MNLKIEQAKHVTSVAKFPSVMFPIMWLEEVSRRGDSSYEFCSNLDQLLIFSFFIGNR